MKGDREAVETAVEILRCAYGGRLAPDDPTKLPYVIILALNGWEDAHRTLCKYADWLTEQQQPLPYPLQLYIVQAAFEGFRVKRRLKNLDRDRAICVAVRQVKDMGYVLTRNEATQTPSAYSLVADALREFGENMTEGAVVKIIKRKGMRLVNESPHSWDKMHSKLSYDTYPRNR